MYDLCTQLENLDLHKMLKFTKLTVPISPPPTMHTFPHTDFTFASECSAHLIATQ